MEKRNLLPQRAIKRPKKKISKPTYQSNYPSETLQLLRLLHDSQPCWSRAVTGHLRNKNFTFQTWNTYQQFAVFKKLRDTCSTSVISPFKKLQHSEDIRVLFFVFFFLTCSVLTSKLAFDNLSPLAAGSRMTLLEDLPCPELITWVYTCNFSPKLTV